jgi:uncharacterized membrane protein HdeD (DUF308 family)
VIFILLGMLLIAAGVWLSFKNYIGGFVVSIFAGVSSVAYGIGTLLANA